MSQENGITVPEGLEPLSDALNTFIPQHAKELCDRYRNSDAEEQKNIAQNLEQIQAWHRRAADEQREYVLLIRRLFIP